MLCVLSFSCIFSLTYAASTSEQSIKSLATLALQVVLRENQSVALQEAHDAVDRQLGHSLFSGDIALADVPSDLKYAIPITSEKVAQDLLEIAGIGYHDRDTPYECDYGQFVHEGKDFVKDRVQFFETVHNLEQIARIIERKAKESTS